MGPPPPREPKNLPQSVLPPSTIDAVPSNEIFTEHAQNAEVVIESANLTSQEGPGNSSSEDSESPAMEVKEIANKTQIDNRPYQIPAWSEPPGQPYYLEVLKDGAIIDTLNVSEKGAYMFGRNHLCDFILEHPTISRYHAVLQYKGNGDVFIYDLGSTHGTVVNKIQVTPNIYKQLHVGDIFRFGTSSRLYVLQGPTELMLPERPAGVRQKLSEINCLDEMADMEASLLRARREASLAEGISWGLREDAVADDIEVEEEEVTWQTYKGQLTEKQGKTRDKIIKRNEKVANLKKEIDAIQAKEIGQGGLTQGQQTQIARNEQHIEQILDELESLEETLNQSIQESVGARIGKPGYAKKKPTDEDEYEGQSDDDEFYDRTKKGAIEKKEERQQMVETAETLLEKKEKLTKEIEDTRVALEAEEPTNEKQNAEGNSESDDPLDAFMTGVSSQIVKDRAIRLQHKLESLLSEMERVVYLLKIADPTGEASLKRETQLYSLNTGQSLSVSVGKPINKSASSDQKNPTILQKKYDVEKINSEDKISLSTAVADVKVLEHDKNTTVGIVKETSAVTKPRWLGAVHNPEDKVQNQGDFISPENVSDSSEFVAYKDRRKAQITSSKEVEISASVLEDAEGLVLRKPKEMGQKSNTRKENREDEKIQCGLTSTTGVDTETSAADAVALLLRHKRGFAASDDEDHSEEPELPSGIAHEPQKKKSRKLGPEKPGFLTQHGTDYDGWVPPQGQTGDGRTSLNDKYGY